MYLGVHCELWILIQHIGVPSLAIFIKVENKLRGWKKQVFTHLTNKSISRDFLHDKQSRVQKTGGGKSAENFDLRM